MVQSNLENTGFTLFIPLYLALSLVKVLKGTQIGLRALKAGANIEAIEAHLHYSLIEMMPYKLTYVPGLWKHFPN